MSLGSLFLSFGAMNFTPVLQKVYTYKVKEFIEKLTGKVSWQDGIIPPEAEASTPNNLLLSMG